MSGDMTGTVVSPTPRRGTWAQYDNIGNTGTAVSPTPRRGTWAQYGDLPSTDRPQLVVGMVLGKKPGLYFSG